MSVPERDGPVAAATANVTVPGPLPLAPDAIVIHGCVLDALQSHPAPPVTFTVRVPPAASTLCASGETSSVQPGDWVTTRAWPAIVTVPVRDGPVVRATVVVTAPVPVPVAAETVIQSTLLDAVHGQPGPAVTVTTCEPPVAPTA
jgi:hypothetical protein